MAKDDYFVLVYKLLGYLYKCLRKEERPSLEIISPNTKDFPISEEYFTYMLDHLLSDGYIEGLARVNRIGNAPKFKETTGIQITPKGIEYLQENSTMKKVAELLGNAGEIVTGIIGLLK